jgi:hypothetical protein
VVLVRERGKCGHERYPHGLLFAPYLIQTVTESNATRPQGRGGDASNSSSKPESSDFHIKHIQWRVTLLTPFSGILDLDFRPPHQMFKEARHR